MGNTSEHYSPRVCISRLTTPLVGQDTTWPSVDSSLRWTFVPTFSSQRQKRKPPGDGLFSHVLAGAVSLALRRFTSVFGMGTGGAASLEPPGDFAYSLRAFIGRLDQPWDASNKAVYSSPTPVSTTFWMAISDELRQARSPGGPDLVPLNLFQLPSRGCRIPPPPRVSFQTRSLFLCLGSRQGMAKRGWPKAVATCDEG